MLFTVVDDKPLARQAQLKCHMQTAFVRMRRRVTRRLIRVQLFDIQTPNSPSLSDIEAL